MENCQLKVIGMHCQNCVKNITALLQAVPGVAKAEAVLDTGLVTIQYDPAKTTVSQFAGVIEGAGFEVD